MTSELRYNKYTHPKYFYRKKIEKKCDLLFSNISNTNNKSCLIIGDGKSKKLINMKHKYKIDTIIGIHKSTHKYTNVVCTVDVSKFNEKEKNVIDNNIPLIYGCISIEKFNLTVPEEYINDIKFMKYDLIQNSGLFAIIWAFKNGYNTIYTAGIDLYSEDKIYMNDIKIMCINYYLNYLSKKTSIYKICKDSLLDIPIKNPPK